MTTLYGSLRLRPTRIGFLVSPTNMAALRRVMQVCTCLWGGAYKALDGPPFPLDHLQLGQTQQVAGMVDAFGGALTGQLVVLAQEGRQPQRLQVMGEQDLRRIAHDDAAPASRLR